MTNDHVSVLIYDYNHHGPLPSLRVPLNYEADPMGFYHIINAYEDSGHLVLDAPFKVGKIKTLGFCATKLNRRRSRYRTTCSRWRIWLPSRTSWRSIWLRMDLLQELVKGFDYYSNDDDGLFLDGSYLYLSPPLSPHPIWGALLVAGLTQILSDR